MPDTSRRPNRYLRDWLSVALWAMLIFVFSSDLFSGSHTGGMLAPMIKWIFPHWSGAAVEQVHLLIRKLGHFSEYFVLALLLMRALRGRAKVALDVKQVFYAAALAGLYAVSDEFHQAFVPSRSASVVDVSIDVCGALAGAFSYLLFVRLKS